MNITIESTFSYMCLSIFVFYQQLHVRSFNGTSAAFSILLSISALLGTVSGIILLALYGWNISWLGAVIIFVIGLFSSIIGFIVEKVVGPFTLSLIGFVGWPVSALYFYNSIFP